MILAAFAPHHWFLVSPSKATRYGRVIDASMRFASTAFVSGTAPPSDNRHNQRSAADASDYTASATRFKPE